MGRCPLCTKEGPRHCVLPLGWRAWQALLCKNRRPGGEWVAWRVGCAGVGARASGRVCASGVCVSSMLIWWGALVRSFAIQSIGGDHRLWRTSFGGVEGVQRFADLDPPRILWDCDDAWQTIKVLSHVCACSPPRMYRYVHLRQTASRACPLPSPMSRHCHTEST